MKTWKLMFGILLVSLLSVGVTVATYSYLNRKNENNFTGNFFSQPGFHNVGYAIPAENTDFTYAAEKSVNAVVHIKSVTRPSERSRSGRSSSNPFFEFFFGDGSQPYQRQPREGFGSGVIISTDGYIVTNNHVIVDADEIEVKTNDDKVFKARLIGGDMLTDVALLKIEGKDFQTLPFGDSDILKVGEWVLAVGNPFNLTSTVTAGIISATGRIDISSGLNFRDVQNRIQSYIQTDAAVNPGNSGGALVNTKGELIGINTAIISQTGNFAGYSFAIPINMVKKIVTDLKQHGIVQRAMLGIIHNELSYLKEEKPDIYNKLNVTEGVYIVELPDTSPSKKAGIQVGDVVTAINGVKIKNGQELRVQLNRYSPGDKVQVQVSRGDTMRTFTVELQNNQGTTEVLKQSNLRILLGANFRELSRETRSRYDINSGIEITEISSGKLRSAGIRNGFVIITANDNNISTPDDLETVVTNILKRDPDDRGLYIRGFYPVQNASRVRIEHFAIDLNDQE